jgi:hypothetical protein
MPIMFELWRLMPNRAMGPSPHQMAAVSGYQHNRARWVVRHPQEGDHDGKQVTMIAATRPT